MLKDIVLSEVYNSCQEKTVKVSIKTENGTFHAISPIGTSKGSFEAKTLNVKATKKMFPSIRKEFIGKNENEVDDIIEKIGIESMGSSLSVALSMAAVRAASKNNAYRFFSKNPRTFPYPLSNVIGGGVHGGYISEQELLVLPTESKTIKEAVDTNVSIWKEVGRKLKPFIFGMNKECAWMCKLDDIRSLDILTSIAEDHGARVGIDFAATSFYNREYVYKNLKRNLSSQEQLDFVSNLISTYKLAYVEDPFQENDFKSFAELSKKVKCLVVGDDLFVTNASRLSEGIRKKAGNAIVIKPNQAGTIARTMKAVNLAKASKYSTIVSHRSCETSDAFIADLAVGIESPIIKIGAHGKDEAKLRRLMEIWDSVKKPEMAKLNFL